MRYENVQFFFAHLSTISNLLYLFMVAFNVEVCPDERGEAEEPAERVRCTNAVSATLAGMYRGFALFTFQQKKIMVMVAILEGKLFEACGELPSSMAAVTMELPWYG